MQSVINSGGGGGGLLQPAASIFRGFLLVGFREFEMDPWAWHKNKMAEPDRSVLL